jgi:hypothetical protein
MPTSAVPRALRPYLSNLVIFASVCFCVILILNVSHLLNGRNPPLLLFALLVPASWIVIIPAAWIVGSRLSSSDSLEYWKQFWPGTPRWMTYALLAILAFNIYLWRVTVWALSTPPPNGFRPDSSAPAFAMTMLCFGMALRVLYSARKESDADASPVDSE